MVAAVTAGPVAGSGGVLALHLAPRYLLLNSLDAALQYRQQGTGAEAELGPGVSCPLRWADAGLPLRLCVRLQEAGWLWSGGFGLDSPGDTFIKVRHRDRGETMLLRVGVAAAAAGTLAVTLSHQPAGFAPYRLENCSLLTLHARQRRVREQQDVLRPYCSLGYAWDEPARPHQLVLELAGGCASAPGASTRVPQDDLVSSPLGPVRVVLRAEGPTRVLTLLDPMRHPFFLRRGAAGLGAPGAGALASVAPGGVGLAPASAGEEETAAASGLQWRVSASLAGVGLSAVVGGCEVAYARATRLAARLAVGPAHLSLGLESAALQLDDPRPRAAFPVVAALPAPRQGLAPRRVDDLLAGGERQAGLAAALTLWRRRPAGVLCVEDARLTCAPLALWLAQEHLEALAGAARVLGRAAGVGGGAGAPGSGGAQEVTGRRSPGVLQLLGGAPLALEADRKLFINLLALAPLRISLSFLPTPLGDGAGTVGPYRRLLSLAEVEDARIRLAALSLHRPLMGQAALGQLLQRHYARAILPEVYKILGSAAVFGDPIRLVHHLGLGVWSVLASPAAGLVESARSRAPAQLLLGLAEGPRAAAAHFAFALSNAAGKTTAAARKAMSALGLDRYTAEYPHRPRRVERDGGSALIWRSGTSLLSGEDQGPTNGRGEALLPATLRGLLGAAHGLVKGSVGVVVLPLASALDMLARTAASVRLAVVGAPALGWTRPPRYVPAGAPLPAYVAEQALGRWLLLELEAAGDHLSEIMTKTSSVPTDPHERLAAISREFGEYGDFLYIYRWAHGLSVFGITSTQLPVDDLARWEAALTPRTRVLYVESVSNPTLVVADIPALAALARAHGLTLVVDNTFAPMIISPIAHGADVVVHSVTKFISGASDVVAGAVVGRAAFIHGLMHPCSGPLMLLGPTMDPKVAAELTLRLPHLALRLREHGARAELFSRRLEALGAAVRYPGLPSHPQAELFARLANPGYGAGGIMTVDLRTPGRAGAFMERLQNKHGFGLLAVSLGYFDTLMSASAASTSSELSDADLEAAGISRGLVRLSVGITGGAEARWAALEEAWRAVASVPDHVVKAPYKAAQIRKDAVTGARLGRTPSWHSFGSDEEGADQAEQEQKRMKRDGPWVRRIDTTTEVEYTPVA
ncbi:Methionine gamma-lyase [Auxenochlorella protothecoides]|uniref:Methionine gamma-lyase n=1 Tax=Auxenochlorella protothecoides TaxID=3075 RepID=A0A087SLV1_AUXPR|nr:Methionine gamma-lyase [Auxenochlorella protothecoides]KFM26705.1 Methionine gamma-lyase [Auxenochlorella protothecoides]